MLEGRCFEIDMHVLAKEKYTVEFGAEESVG